MRLPDVAFWLACALTGMLFGITVAEYSPWIIVMAVSMTMIAVALGITVTDPARVEAPPEA